MKWLHSIFHLPGFMFIGPQHHGVTTLTNTFNANALQTNSQTDAQFRKQNAI